MKKFYHKQCRMSIVSNAEKVNRAKCSRHQNTNATLYYCGCNAKAKVFCDECKNSSNDQIFHKYHNYLPITDTLKRRLEVLTCVRNNVDPIKQAYHQVKALLKECKNKFSLIGYNAIKKINGIFDKSRADADMTVRETWQYIWSTNVKIYELEQSNHIRKALLDKVANLEIELGK